MNEPLKPVRPPESSRRGGAAIWIGVGVIVLLAVAMFGFLAEPEGRVGDDLAPPGAVLVDEGAAVGAGD
ncbi:hypothetical protein [Jannaschia sp. W003]|uniref:hypothetical protein n=1 Tax=Jannaschia sp. W003 TaxID=2867012 RepID=UPI0021A95A61|nr:hypothetical protein [Jannaschia sp. W003]UWQ22365.1 hypothetical protein K3554_04835 [Jannaschia sp. W003]